MPALGMAQEKGRLIRWLVEPGATVGKGDPLMEIETDKAAVEVEAPASGVLAQVTAAAGDDVPVAQVIAVILAPGELAANIPNAAASATRPPLTGTAMPSASPVAQRVAAEHGVDLRDVMAQGRRIEKADVLAYVEAGGKPETLQPRLLASPKARRLAAEQALDLEGIPGSGPGGAIITADVLRAVAQAATLPTAPVPAPHDKEPLASGAPPTVTTETMSTLWRVMAERMTQSWTTVPHFYLLRDVNAESLIAWRATLLKRFAEKITYTDLLTKLVATALARHPRLTATWHDGTLVSGSGVHVGIAVAVENGLVVPVIHDADRLGIREIAHRRQELVGRAQAGRLRPADLADGVFTISNLGMYNVDAFIAIVNPPQPAILAVGRITDHVVAVNGQPAVRPIMILSLSCDHRVVDGARAAAFLDTVATLIEEPLGILD
jgi:pyruvate dehydrogenase E2 component (dihydrolipoamide acetyltransferase)